MTGRVRWGPVLEQAREIMAGYDTGVTLRQLYYRLVAVEAIPNKKSAYSTLSDVSAKARRAGEFPDFIDRTRRIHRYTTYPSPDAARQRLAATYRRDRTEGQEWAVYIGVEKAGIVEQLMAWFGDLSIPIVALGGFASQTYVKQVLVDAARQPRPAVLIYAGDFDPSGEDIDRDFVARTGCWDRVHRIALNAEQVVEYDLPAQMGKSTDSRAAGFVERHGELVQVELDALPLDALRGLYADAIRSYWDRSAYETVLEREHHDRQQLETTP